MQRLLSRLRALILPVSAAIDRYEVLKYGVAALLLTIPIYPKFPFLAVGGTYVSIRLEDFLMLLVSALWLVWVLPNGKSLLRNRIGQAIIIFWVVSLASLISAVFLTKSVDYHIGLLHFARRIEYMITFFIGLTTVKSRKDLEFYIKCIFIVIAAVFVFGIGQKYMNWPVITTQNSEYSKGVALRYMSGGHLASTFAGHYDLAAYIILTSPVVFVLTFADVFKNKKIRAFLFVFILFSFWLLVNTISRISIVSYMLSVCLALFLIKKKKYILPFVIIAGVWAGMSAGLIERYKGIFQAVKDKLGSLIVPEAHAQATMPPNALQNSAPAPFAEDRSSSIRFNVEWPRALRALSKNPLMGTGFSSITLATDNDYLRALGEIGLTGFLAFILIFKRIFEIVWSKLRSLDLNDTRDLFFIGVISSIPGILLNAVFIDVFESSKFAIMFWLLLGLALANKENAKAN